MEGRFAGRVVIVTGGASGIGATTARAFSAGGARFVVAAGAREGGGEVAGAPAGVFEAVDVADAAAVRALVERTVAAHRRIDVLVSNAFATTLGPIERFTLDAWTRTLAVTLTAAFTGLQAVAPIMRAQGGGAVVNVASISGLGGDRGLAAYNAAKAGMINLTRTAALELASAGIRVNAVCPGLIATPALARALGGAPEREERARAAVPVGRFGRREEVARAILFLASDDASYITGTTLVVDGGLTAGTGIPDLMPGS